MAHHIVAGGRIAGQVFGPQRRGGDPVALRDLVHVRIISGDDCAGNTRRGRGELYRALQQRIAGELEQVFARDAFRAAPNGDDGGHFLVSDHVSGLPAGQLIRQTFLD